MNNEQFRRLVASTPRNNGAGTSTPKAGAATPAASLGARQRSSIPMTPRTVRGSTGVDFARQLADSRASTQPERKFRSSAAPKGTKLAAGYTDRTLARDNDEEGADDTAARIKALEESMKLGQIDAQTFEQLRDELVGGDVRLTHLVKGLDRRLLERVRRGEDVLGVGKGGGEIGDVDEEFEKMEVKEVAPVVHEKVEKKGTMAPPPPVAGAKRTRDAILAELKAQRKAAAEAKAASQPQLGVKFRRVGEKRETTRFEHDDKGREVMIITDEEGNEKRKVRKLKDQSEELPAPDKDAKPLGMEVPEFVKPTPPPEEEEDDDIFEGAGADYNPLAGMEDDDDDTSEDEEEGQVKEKSAPKDNQEKPLPDLESPTEVPETDEALPQPVKPRNYFNDKPSATEEPHFDVTKDPAILAALQKARKIDLPADSRSEDISAEDLEKEERLRRRAAMLAQDRDLEDMDMGFGSSRFDDAEDLDAEDSGKVKLAQWKGMGADDDDDDDERKGKGGKQRKRGPKKKKGDKNNAADVLKVIERRKAGA